MSRYLYNGVELPALPEYDQTAYPYAYIKLTHWNDNGGVFSDQIDHFELVAFSKFIYTTTTNGAHAIYHEDEDTIGWKIPVDTENNQTAENWEVDTSFNGAYTTFVEDWTIWSNFDVLGADGQTVIYHGTDPVPVGVLALTASDLYKKVNGQLVKHTLYKKIGGVLVKVDEYTI